MPGLIEIASALCRAARPPQVPPPRPFSEALAGVRRVDYRPMTYGSDRVDYGAPSMLLYAVDPIQAARRLGLPATLRLVPGTPEAELARALDDLVRTEDLGIQRVRLDQISGLSNARERDHGSLRAFGDRSSGRYGFETDEDWDRNWTRGVLAFLRNAVRPVVTHRTRDDRWFLHVDDGAHRLAAASRQDREQGRGTTFEAPVSQERIDPAAAATVLRLAVGLLLDEEARSAVLDLLSETDYRPFFAASRESRVRALWLPRADERTRELVGAIKSAAPRAHVFDVTEWLRRVAAGTPSAGAAGAP